MAFSPYERYSFKENLLWRVYPVRQSENGRDSGSSSEERKKLPKGVGLTWIRCWPRPMSCLLTALRKAAGAVGLCFANTIY